MKKNKKISDKIPVKKIAVRAEREEDTIRKTKIKVIGIGGGGSSIVSEIAPKLKKVEFIVANTDFQALKSVPKDCKRVYFGQGVARGLGCGMDPKIGKMAAQAEKEKFIKSLQGADLCILIASLGGGAGSGAAPVIAEALKENHQLTFGIFTVPFKFEGEKKSQIAKAAIEKLRPSLSAIAVIPNEKIFQLIDKKTPIQKAFSSVNKVLTENLEGLVEMIYVPGIVNIDFADLRTILDGRGNLAYLSTAFAQGPNRVEEVSKKVLQSPLNDYDIKGADKIVFNITASKNVGMKEVADISKTISDFNPKAKIIFGISEGRGFEDKIKITLLAAGCGKEEKLSSPPKILKLRPENKKKKKVSNKKTKNVSSKKNGLKRKKASKKTIKPKKKMVKKPKNIKRKIVKSPKIKNRKIQKKNSPRVIKVRAPLVETDSQIKEREAPIFSPNMPSDSIRRSGLDIKKAADAEEEKKMAEEKKWDIPAFLRRSDDKK